MEILNNTVVIPAELSLNIKESSETLTLKVPGNVLFDIYSNGKRCICKTESEMGLIFDIVSAYMERGTVFHYGFLAVLFSGTRTINLLFTSEGSEEPTFTVKG